MMMKNRGYHVVGLVLIIVVFVSIFSSNLVVHAGGWIDIAENVKLNKWYTEMLDDSDYYEKASISGGEYYDAYKFKVKKKGILKIKLMTDEGFDHRVGIYKASNVTGIYLEIL